MPREKVHLNACLTAYQNKEITVTVGFWSFMRLAWMRFQAEKLVTAAALAVFLVPCFAVQTLSYDQYVYDNLQKSRDALLAQRDELQRAYNDIAGQVDRLNQKLSRYDAYLHQVDDSLRDVNRALDQMQ
jgi:hypothetical protein